MSSDRRLVLELLGDGASQAELPRSGVLTLGSAADKVGFIVQGQGVSEVHCAIGRAKGGGFALKDLGSEYGTWVNGERVQQAKLDAGDVILVGSRRLRVIDPAAPPPLPNAPPAAAAPAKPAEAKLAEVAPAEAKGSAPRESPAPKPPLAPTAYEHSPFPKIPGYRIEKLLGRGGMGEVFLATQERLDRKVALKLLSAKLSADADFVRRFQDEARAAAALTHPNVVVVHDVGEEAGRHFLSMEFMDRGTLETRVARGGRMSWAEVLGVLHDMASALVYAESRGIVHRDLKPANMMQGAAGATKLADLGLATQIEAEASETEGGRIFGTPHFISPEQARGERVDGRSDLYSLGATAYRLLSGRTPFEGATTRDILRGHFFEKPLPLSELDRELPPDLVRIVERLLEKKPDDRYPSAGALLKEVDRVRANLLHSDVPQASAGRSPKAAAVAALVVIAGAVAWYLGRDSEPEPPVAPPLANHGAPPSNAPPSNAPPDDPAPPPVDAAASGDNETRMQLFETKAKLAWRELPADLPSAERAKKLTELASEFAGTSAASEMRAEAQRIQDAIHVESAASAERAERLRTAGAALANAAAPHAGSPAKALEALNAWAVPPELAQDAAFQAERAAIYQRVLVAGIEAAQAERRAVDAAADRGEFDDLSRRLEAMQNLLDLPPLPEGLDEAKLPEYSALKALARELAVRREGLQAERSRFAVARVDADKKRVAAELGRGGEFERELGALEFDALDARLARLETELSTESARSMMRQLRTDFGRGRAVLTGVAAEFAGWKRKTISDPRGTRGAVRNAVAADAQGVTLEVDGRNEVVPWSQFGGKPEKLNFLFNERLTRAYTPEEALGIEALMRTAAVLAAVDAASEMFDPSGSARFDEGELKELNACFTWGKSWAALAGATEHFERECNAAELLAQSLLDSSKGAWSAAVAGIERLLREFGDTLLVRMLSDGRPLSGG